MADWWASEPEVAPSEAKSSWWEREPTVEKNEAKRALGRGALKGALTVPDLAASLYSGGTAGAFFPEDVQKIAPPSQTILDAMGSKPVEGKWPKMVEALTSGAVGGLTIPGGAAAARALTGAGVGGALEAVPDEVGTVGKVSAAMVAALLGHSVASGARWAVPESRHLGIHGTRTERVVQDATRGIPEGDWTRAQALIDEGVGRGIPLTPAQAFAQQNPLHGLQDRVNTVPELAADAASFFRGQRDTAADQLRARVASLDVRRTGRTPPIVRDPSTLFTQTPAELAHARRLLGARFPALARQAFEEQVERAFGQTSRGMESPTAFGDFTSAVFGAPMETAKRENFRAIMREVVQSYPGNRANVNEVVTGAERFMEFMQAVARSRPAGGAAQVGEHAAADQLRVLGGFLGYTSAAYGALTRILGHKGPGRVDRELGRLFFSPDGFRELRAISRLDPHRIARGTVAGSVSPILQEITEKEQSGAF